MNPMKSAGALVAILALTIQGCALKPQNLHLDPDVAYSGEAMTSETLIGFSVTDARPTKKLGEVGDPNTELVPVSLDEDFVPLVTERMTTGIEKRGFSVVPWSPAMTRSLEVRIDSLEVTAVASNERQQYERVYYVRSYQETAGPPYEKHSNKLVNQAVSQALTEVLKDDKLFEMLAN
jgi:uncharacterized lipoprotein YajG